ncbi:MAG: response regulator transcription factor [Bacteroidales bacterium]|nr:response regulator transcription factor [Bacteroidales bacterium]
MLRTLIIDDETHMRQTLETLLHKHCPNVKLVGMADGVASGLASIRRHHPDLVLLDIRMADGTGFDLLRKAEPIDFRIIFITAYDQYAIDAFRFSALDYLLKPVIPQYLAEAVQRAAEQKMKDLELQLQNLKNHMGTEGDSMRKIVLRTMESIHVIPVEDILYCASDSNYTTFILAGSKRIVVSKTLKEYEDMLRGSGFFRVHKSYLVNLSNMIRLDKGEGGTLVMGNDDRIPVGASRKEQLMELFDKLGDR